MKIIGIVIECNPLHKGHIFFINQIKEIHPDSLIISMMSGNVVQRGEISISSKFSRSIDVIKNGIDIVFEIPAYYSLSSSDHFASFSINFLNEIGVKKIFFGSESNNLNKLKTYAKKILNYDLNKNKNKEISYPKQVEKIIGKRIKSNDTLGISYIKEILRNKLDIDVQLIKRNRKYNSSTKIRENILSNKSKHQNIFDTNDFFDLIKYSLIKYSGDNIILNYLSKNINKYNNWANLIKNISTKNFTKSRIRREILIHFFSIKKGDYKKIRLLKSSSKGKKYLSKNKNLNLLYSTKFLKKYENELKISKILDLKYKDSFNLEIGKIRN